jgi:hypothetical protein
MQLAISDKTGLMSVRPTATCHHQPDGDPSSTPRCCSSMSITDDSDHRDGGRHGTAVDRNDAACGQPLAAFYNATNPKLFRDFHWKRPSRDRRFRKATFSAAIVSRLPGPIGASARCRHLGLCAQCSATACRRCHRQSHFRRQRSNLRLLNYGLGKSIAFTSDVTGRWGSAWRVGMNSRNSGRSRCGGDALSSPANLIVNTRQARHGRGSRALALTSSVNFMQTDGGARSRLQRR